MTGSTLMGSNAPMGRDGSSSVRSIPLVTRAVLLSTAGRRGRRVVQLAGASDWRRASLDAAASMLIGALGTRLLPTTPGWAWPAASAGAIEAALAEVLPGIELLGAITPRQHGRERLSLLVEMDGEPVVVKLGRPGTGIEREAGALRLLQRNPLPCIRTPLVIADGFLAGDALAGNVAFIATSAIGLDRQRAAVDEPLRTFERDVGERLGELPRPAGVSTDHVPIHGDLTPWNLRRTPRGLALFDWEDAGWGSPGTDVDGYRRACGTLPRRLRRRADEPRGAALRA